MAEDFCCISFSLILSSHHHLSKKLCFQNCGFLQLSQVEIIIFITFGNQLVTGILVADLFNFYLFIIQNESIIKHTIDYVCMQVTCNVHQ